MKGPKEMFEPITLVGVSNYDLMSLHWMARRYADGRSSYSPGLFNGVTRKLIASGVELKEPFFARDGMGRKYDGLTDEQAQAAEDDMPRGFTPEPNQRLADALEALSELLPESWRDGTMDHMPGVAKARAVLDASRADSGTRSTPATADMNTRPGERDA